MRQRRMISHYQSARGPVPTVTLPAFQQTIERELLLIKFHTSKKKMRSLQDLPSYHATALLMLAASRLLYFEAKAIQWCHEWHLPERGGMDYRKISEWTSWWYVQGHGKLIIRIQACNIKEIRSSALRRRLETFTAGPKNTWSTVFVCTRLRIVWNLWLPISYTWIT